MSKITEATVIGYFPDDVKLALSKPFNGARFRQMLPPEPPYVADIFTAAFRNVNPDKLVEFVSEALRDYNAVLILDDDHSTRARMVRFVYGKVEVDTGDES